MDNPATSPPRLVWVVLGTLSAVALAAVLVMATGAPDEAPRAAPTTTASTTPTTTPEPTAPPVDADPAPEVEFEMFDGATATFADYRGRPLVVNFWASWCPSCVAEMSAAFRPAQLTVGDRVDFLGLNLADERDEAVRLVEETGVLFDVAEDPDGAVYRALGGLGMPFTVFISADGSVVEVHNGPLTEAQLLERIDEHLLS